MQGQGNMKSLYRTRADSRVLLSGAVSAVATACGGRNGSDASAPDKTPALIAIDPPSFAMGLPGGTYSFASVTESLTARKSPPWIAIDAGTGRITAVAPEASEAAQLAFRLGCLSPRARDPEHFRPYSPGFFAPKDQSEDA
jgi:hypothetical protein